jgi:hypothetical protein
MNNLRIKASKYVPGRYYFVYAPEDGGGMMTTHGT